MGEGGREWGCAGREGEGRGELDVMERINKKGVSLDPCFLIKRFSSRVVMEMGRGKLGKSFIYFVM